MSLLYDLYQPRDSWLHRVDPRVKLLFVLSGCTLLLLCRNIWVILATMGVLQGVLLSAHIARMRIAWVWKMTAPTMTMIALLWIALYKGPGPILLSWWFVEITAYNLAEGFAMALRIGALAFVIFVWLFSTDQATLVRGLVSLGLPYEWGLTLAMALRYLPTMANVFGMISDAQQARALDLSKGNPIQRARAYIPITVAMLITALRTAQSLSYALESRALGASRRRTDLHQLHYRRVDLAWTLGVVAGTALLLWARYAVGLGADPLRLWR